MARTLLETQEDFYSAVKPLLIVNRLNDICRDLTPGRQEDAHEFLRHLIDIMNENFLTRHIDNLTLDDYSKSTTPVNQIFGGCFRSTITCKVCKNRSEKFEHFMELSVDISQCYTLKDAIKAFFADEELEDSSYECKRCDRKVSAKKRTEIEVSPVVLCVQLKRFSSTGAKLRKKIQASIHLDLSHFFSQASNNNERSYFKLVSLVTHCGYSAAGGHYTAVGLTPNGRYFSFNDVEVETVGIHNVLRDSNAYLLFYEVHDRDMSCGRGSTSTESP
jgi:ubiquitin carboxyl-terminal hydrolase 36/42